MDKEFERMRIMKFINDKRVPYGREAFLHYYDSLKLNETGEQVWNKIKDELQKKKPEERYKIVEKGNEKYVFYNGIDEIVLENKIDEKKNNKQSSIQVINIQQKDLKIWTGNSGTSENKLYIYDNERYMVKYSKTLKNRVDAKDLTIHRQTALTEYLASHLLNLYGVKAQNTLLGYDVMKQDYCVLCKDFTKGKDLIELDNITKSRTDEELRDQRYIIHDLKDYVMPKIYNSYHNIDTKEAIDNWILITVTDWLIGNRDRHVGNIGYIDISENRTQDKWEIPPIWDNGASLGCYLHIEDDYKWDENIKQTVIYRQRLYQLYSGIQVNYNNIVNHKLPKVFYEKISQLLNNKNIIGLELFDEMKKLQYLDKQQRCHIQLAKDIYQFNFNVLKSVI